MAPFPRPQQLIPAFVLALPLGGTLLLSGCDEKVDAGVAKVRVGGKDFFLEVVDTDEKRYLGLGKREQDLEENGGMLFVFTAPQVQGFVMRDCKFDIDIIFLDAAGRVLKTHAMKAESPRGADEREDVPVEDDKYNARLPKYSSKFPAQFVIEIKGGSLAKLNVKEGELIKQNWEALKRAAQ
jgi:uncharacterized membrane protein (UPF0127 family)